MLSIFACLNLLLSAGPQLSYNHDVVPPRPPPSRDSVATTHQVFISVPDRRHKYDRLD